MIGILVSVLGSLPSRLVPKLIQRDSLSEVQQIIEEGINEAKQTIQEEMRKQRATTRNKHKDIKFPSWQGAKSSRAQTST